MTPHQLRLIREHLGLSYRSVAAMSSIAGFTFSAEDAQRWEEGQSAIPPVVVRVFEPHRRYVPLGVR